MRKNNSNEEYQAGYDYGYALAYNSEKELRPDDEEVKSYYNGEKSFYNIGVVDGIEEANRTRFDESYEYAEQKEEYDDYLKWKQSKEDAERITNAYNADFEKSW